MAEFVVNVTLIGAVLLLLVIWAVSATRSRRRSRRERAAERRVILSAFTTAGAAQASLATGEGEVPASPPRPSARPNNGPVAAAPPLDAASVAALLDLLEDRRPARHGLVAGLFTSPRSVWTAGANAGQNVARRTMREREQAGAAGAAGAELCRDAAAELVDIHAHSPANARAEYSRYAATLPDPALAELYVRSAAYATYADHDQLLDVVASITATAREVSDDAVNIDT